MQRTSSSPARGHSNLLRSMCIRCVPMATPPRVLKGAGTQIKNPTGIFVDTVHDELIVANMGNHSATVYPRTAQGDMPPARMIRTGPLDKPALQIGNPGSVAYDT